MPVKRRTAKQRAPDSDLGAWSMLFTSGNDYLSELRRWFATEDEARAAAGAAWHRLGAEFMATWQPTSHRPRPWALEQFGPPPA